MAHQIETSVGKCDHVWHGMCSIHTQGRSVGLVETICKMVRLSAPTEL